MVQQVDRNFARSYQGSSRAGHWQLVRTPRAGEVSCGQLELDSEGDIRFEYAK